MFESYNVSNVEVPFVLLSLYSLLELSTWIGLCVLGGGGGGGGGVYHNSSSMSLHVQWISYNLW